MSFWFWSGTRQRDTLGELLSADLIESADVDIILTGQQTESRVQPTWPSKPEDPLDRRSKKRLPLDAKEACYHCTTSPNMSGPARNRTWDLF